ncbi:transporter [Paraburkholderia sediminicola]|uniref:SphA family protein n=1 Tax=Paraburkholderia sediminicola TaxID=458836 RepID=UPI0038BBA1A8
MVLEKVVKIVATFVLLGVTTVASATENGQQSYPIGVETVLNAIVPEPGGTQFYNYMSFYLSDRLIGENGTSLVPTFKANVLVDAPRVMHTWGSTLGPITLSSGFVIPIIHAETSLPTGSGDRWGFGDLVVHGLTAGYATSGGRLFSAFAFDFALPTGSFSKTSIANTGLNSYAFIPNFKVTAFPFRDWEFSSTVGYEINSPNHADGYHSGNLIFLEWVAGYSVLPRLQLAVQGYALQQITNDTQNGVAVDGNGFRGRTIAIGPQVRFNFSADSGVVFKWQHEFSVRNRPEGDELWVEFSFPLKD